MNKFDLEIKVSENDTDSTPESDSLRPALSALPALSPPQDRLDVVLRALATKYESADAQQVKLQAHKSQRSYRKYIIYALAASLLISVTALFLRPSQQLATIVMLPVSDAVPAPMPDASSEIAQLIVVSQQLEAGLRDLGEDSASFSQLYGRKQAELSLATLDTELAEVMASNSGQAVDEQRALWRERVAVLNAVENGDYRQALFVID